MTRRSFLSLWPLPAIAALWSLRKSNKWLTKNYDKVEVVAKQNAVRFLPGCWSCHNHDGTISIGEYVDVDGEWRPVELRRFRPTEPGTY